MRAKSIYNIVMATTSFLASPALADQTSNGPPVRTGSPSNATSTVSPISAAQALDRRAPDEPSLDVSLGTSYASGDFGGTTNSHIWSTALGARLSFGSLRLNASIPHMRIRSNGIILTGIDSTPVIVSRGTGRRITYDGIGDLTLGATYTLPAAPDDVEIEVSGRIKLPTASRSSGLSSRKVDYSAGIQATKVIGQMAPFVSATYRIFGDPQGIRLKDGVAASAGTSLIVDDRTVLLASYHFAQKASNLITDSHELFAGVSRSFADNRFRLSGYATAGLSDGAAGASGGVSISVRL